MHILLILLHRVLFLLYRIGAVVVLLRYYKFPVKDAWVLSGTMRDQYDDGGLRWVADDVHEILSYYEE